MKTLYTLEDILRESSHKFIAPIGLQVRIDTLPEAMWSEPHTTHGIHEHESICEELMPFRISFLHIQDLGFVI